MANQKLVYDILKGKNTLATELTKSKKESSNLTKGIQSAGSAMSSVALGAVAVAGALAGAASAFVTVKAVRESIQLKNALLGLSSVAAGTGQNVDSVKNIAKELASDGLVPLTDAATSLKNLLASGFSEDEAVKTFKVLRDSAAFGRQGSLDIGEAIRGATEGIKNGNSVLVDNAGITKNLSVLQKEYADSINKTVGSLTEAEKRQAVFNGLQREGALFAGDYVRLQKEYSGAVAKVSGSFTFLTARIGDFITENAVIARTIAQTGETFNKLTEILNKNEKSITIFVDSFVKGFNAAIPVAIGLAQNMIAVFGYLQTSALKFIRAVAGIIEFVYNFELLQDVIRVTAVSFSFLVEQVFSLMSLISGTSVGASFIEKALGLDPEGVQSKLDEIKEGINEFRESVTGSEIADSLAEGGSFLEKVIGTEESGLARINEAFEVVKEGARKNAEELNAIETNAQKAKSAIISKGTAERRKEFKADLLYSEALFGKYKSFEESTNKERAANFKSTLGNIATLSQDSNSTLFRIGQAAAISNATIDGISAVQKALASAPPPFNFALAALVGVATAANVTKIASAKPPAFQDGGYLSAPTSSGDGGLARFNDRELFLNRSQQSELFNLANGRGGSQSGSGGVNRVEVVLNVAGRELARVIRDLQSDGYMVA